MQRDRIPEIVAAAEHPFIGERPGIVNGICKLFAEIHGWHEQLQRFRAIVGKLRDDERILRFTPLPDFCVHHIAMIPHHHPGGSLLFTLDGREGSTVVCSDSKSRVY